MERVYRESLYQEMIRDHPEVFLGEPLRLESRHPMLHGFVPDLVFRDEQGVPLIVEVQLEALDRAHLYRTLEYRDLYKLRTGVPVVRLVLFCNSLKVRHKPLVDIHGITVVTMSRAIFLAHCKRLYPGIKILRSSRQEKPKLFTNARILSELSKTVEPPHECPQDLWVLWTRGWDDPRDDFRNLQALNLAPIGHTPSRDDNWAVPAVEWLVNEHGLDGLSKQRLRALVAWCTWLYGVGPAKEVVVLGYQAHADPFEYDNYVWNRKRKMNAIVEHYLEQEGREWTWNLDRLRSDLDHLSRVILHAGPPSLPIETRSFERFDIVTDPGPLWERVERNRKHVASFSPSGKKTLEEDIERRRSSFVTITFEGMRPTLFEPLRQLFEHLLGTHVSAKGDTVRMAIKCSKCLAVPKRMSKISSEAMRLSETYLSRAVPSLQPDDLTA